MKKLTLIKTTTVALSLDVLLKGQLQFLNQHYKVIALSGQDAHLEKVKSREGVETLAVSMQRNISPWHDFKSLFKLYQVFKKEKPAIVHSMTPKAGLLTMTAAYFAGIDVRMHTFTGLIFPSKKGFLKWLLIKMDQLLCNFATHIYPEGAGVKNDLLAYKITSKPLKVIGPGQGVDTKHFNPDLYSDQQKEALKSKLEITQTDCIFIYVGRLVTDKGINELVQAFKQLASNNKNCKLLLVGPEEKTLDPLNTKTTETIKNNSTIVTAGFQNDIRPYLAIGHVFVFPSYREGFPNVVMEAGAMRLPCIVTNINGCNEIIEEGINGALIPPKNKTALLKSMEKMLKNTIYRDTLAHNARNIIVKKYPQERIWNDWLKEYQTLVV